MLRRLVPRTVFKTVGPHGNHVVGGFDSHAFPPIDISPGRAIPRTATHRQTNPSDVEIQQTRCFGCFRPLESCYCDLIPTIENQTNIVVLQHSKERDHPFNTARMVRKALKNSQLHCGNNARLSGMDLGILPEAGLLYPSKDSVCLEEVSASDTPKQLVILDGTWPQARTMLRDIPQLKRLKKYHLNPTTPGQYRIRLEPNETSLSTVEAVVSALRSLEPEKAGFDLLINTFNQMVERQFNHPEAAGRYTGGPRSGATINVPKLLLGDPRRIVVAYGEASYRNPRTTRKQDLNSRPPLVWVAHRLEANETHEPMATSNSQTFVGFLEPDVEMTPSFLRHLGLSEERFRSPMTTEQFKAAWRSFVDPQDLLVVFNQGSIRLLENIDADFTRHITLKSVNLGPDSQGKTTGQFLNDQNIEREPLLVDHGRAGERLVNEVALVNFLRQLKA